MRSFFILTRTACNLARLSRQPVKGRFPENRRSGQRPILHWQSRERPPEPDSRARPGCNVVRGRLEIRHLIRPRCATCALSGWTAATAMSANAKARDFLVRSASAHAGAVFPEAHSPQPATLISSGRRAPSAARPHCQDDHCRRMIPRQLRAAGAAVPAIGGRLGRNRVAVGHSRDVPLASTSITSPPAPSASAL